MKSPLLLAVASFLLGMAGTVSAVQARCLPPELYSCSTRMSTPCGEYLVPKGICFGDACYRERPATFCPGIVDNRGTTSSTPSAPATMRYIANMNDKHSGQAAGKIAAAQASKLPNQHIVGVVMFTCPAPPDPAEPEAPVVVPPVEEPPKPEVVIPDPVQQVYKDVRIIGRHPGLQPIISEPFDIVVRDASVLSFAAGVPPFSRIGEGVEASGDVSVYGGEGAITIGMTGAPSWMVLVEETLAVNGRTYTKMAIANPPAGSAGFYRDIRITAQDATGRTLVSPPFTVEVVGAEGLRIVSNGASETTTQGGYYYLFVAAEKAKKWVSFDVIGGPPGANPVEPVAAVQDGRAFISYRVQATHAGVWKDVVFRATDDQGRVAYSEKFSITVSASKTCAPGVPVSLSAESAPPLSFRSPYQWRWNSAEDLQISVKGDLPPGVGLCTDGTYGLCGTPTANGSWSGEISFANQCGGTKTIGFALENEVSDRLRPCTGRFSPNNGFVITETDDAFVISNTKGKEVSFCTPPYNQWDGGDWSKGDNHYSSMYKSSSSYDFIYPFSSLQIGYNWFGGGPMSFVYGSPPQEVYDCIASRPNFCTDNIVFRAGDALPSATPGARSDAIYLSGRDWRGRFWGAKKIFVEY